MRRYYWAAKAVTQLNQILLLNIEARLNPNTQDVRPINDYCGEKAGMLEVLRDDVYTQHPHAILQTFLLYQTTLGIKGLSARTLRALDNTREVINTAFRKDPVNRATFMAILQQPDGLTHAMRLMNQTSVLGRYLWVFRKIVGQMQHDLFHVYTVDQHILMVLRNMRRFFIPEHAHEYPLCSQLAAGWDKPWILYTAALFHDIAKCRGGDHSALGRRDARQFCRKLQVSKADTALVTWLVEMHLQMSAGAQKQDLSDPDVISQFAQRVGDDLPHHLLAAPAGVELRHGTVGLDDDEHGRCVDLELGEQVAEFLDLARLERHRPAEPDVDRVIEITRRLLVHRHPADVHEPRLSPRQLAARALQIWRDTHRVGEVGTGTDGKHPQRPDDVAIRRRVRRCHQAVDDFVRRAVTAGCHDDIKFVVRRRCRQLNGVAWSLRADQIEIHPFGRQITAQVRFAARAITTSRNRVKNHLHRSHLSRSPLV